MYKDKSIAVVVPAYNEETQIGRVIETMPAFVDKIIVVDDCSKDKTADIVKEHQKKAPQRVILVCNAQNSGVGRTIINGYKRAIDEKADITVVMAGDGQMDPADLPNLLDPVAAGEVDYAKGNRLFTKDVWRVMPRWRYIGNAFLSMMTKIASGYWHVADSQTGYTAINLKTIQAMPLDSIYPRYGMPNDFLIKLNVINARVRDIPIKPVYNIGEKSGIKGYNVIFSISLLILHGFYIRMTDKYIIKDFHPLIFFYAMGLTLFPAGLIFGFALLWHRIFTGPVAATSVMFASFLFISGLQSLFFAMWFDMESNKDLR